MTRFETRAVLGGAYLRGHIGTRPMLSHAVEVDQDGRELRVLCGRVALDSIADRHAQDTTAPPTCTTCVRRLRRGQYEGTR